MIRTKTYDVDTGRRMRPTITVVDTSYLTELAYDYVDHCNGLVMSLKGSPNDNKYSDPLTDRNTFRQSKEKGNLYLVESNTVKDQLSGTAGS